MEVALGPQILITVIFLQCSFNPCFRGSRPRTKFHQKNQLLESLVSILVFVEVALGPIIANDDPNQGFGFQSLFSWKSPSDKINFERIRRAFGVSILVFVEVALGLFTSDFILII